MIVDSHAHLEMGQFRADLDQVIARASAAGVGEIVTVATTRPDFSRAIGISKRYPGVWAAAGYHPHEASKVGFEEMEHLKSLAPSLVAIGETGLDYYRMHSPENDQRRVFKWHLDLAFETGLPVIVHLRQDRGEFLDIAGDYLTRLSGVVHCFSGDLAMARKVIKAGWLISIPGTITFSSNHPLREIVKAVPLESIMVETDCPYLAPVPYRGKRNEPAYVVEVVKTVAAVKNLSRDEVADTTAANAKSLFRVNKKNQPQ